MILSQNGNVLLVCLARDRMMGSCVRKSIIIGIGLTSYSTLVRADDYKATTDAAYCVGVYQSDVKDWKDGMQSRFTEGKIADVGQKLFRKQAFVEGAIKQGKIDGATASKMTSVGYADTQLCSNNQKQCCDGWSERDAKKVDNELNNKQLEYCNKQTESICNRAYKNCD